MGPGGSPAAAKGDVWISIMKKRECTGLQRTCEWAPSRWYSWLPGYATNREESSSSSGRISIRRPDFITDGIQCRMDVDFQNWSR
jgi:hypothetical protein